MCEYAPNFRSSVLGCEVFLPVDLERAYGMTGGQIFHGDLMPGQVLWGRRCPASTGTAPGAGVYLCGAGRIPAATSAARPGTTPPGRAQELPHARTTRDTGGRNGAGDRRA